MSIRDFFDEHEGFFLFVVMASAFLFVFTLYFCDHKRKQWAEEDRIDRIEKQIETLEQKMEFLGNGR